MEYTYEIEKGKLKLCCLGCNLLKDVAFGV